MKPIYKKTLTRRSTILAARVSSRRGNSSLQDRSHRYCPKNVEVKYERSYLLDLKARVMMQGSQDISLPRQQHDLRLPETDAEGLAAYLHLFTQIFSTASVADIESWTSQLEASIRKQPLWGIFFQLMCHPVPQVLQFVQLDFRPINYLR